MIVPGDEQDSNNSFKFSEMQREKLDPDFQRRPSKSFKAPNRFEEDYLGISPVPKQINSSKGSKNEFQKDVALLWSKDIKLSSGSPSEMKIRQSGSNINVSKLV